MKHISRKTRLKFGNQKFTLNLNKDQVLIRVSLLIDRYLQYSCAFAFFYISIQYS